MSFVFELIFNARPSDERSFKIHGLRSPVSERSGFGKILVINCVLILSLLCSQMVLIENLVALRLAHDLYFVRIGNIFF